MYGHLLGSESNVARTRKEMLHSASKCYELYLRMLRLLPDLRDYAKGRMEQARGKFKPTPQELNPNMRFVENPLFAQIEECPEFYSLTARYGWAEQESILRDLYKSLLESKFYQKYMEAEEVTFADHRKVLVEIYKNLIEENSLIESFLEDHSIFWIDDIGYALGFAISTLKSLESQEDVLSIQDQYTNEHDEFACELLERAILNHNSNIELIDSLVENWDVERIALMDRVLISVALTEFVTFESIPVKATMDEFIEISKYYSTPQSSTFINGVLDKACQELKSQGRIVKLGRGVLQK